MANLKEIRNRISSVSSTMQITSAMKMVSAAKLKKAQDAITAMRPYADKLTELLQNLSASLEGDSGSVYADNRFVNKVLIVSITSNRGFLGKRFNVIANHSGVYDDLTFDNVAEIAESLMKLFTNGDYDRIEIVYNKFKNAATQIVMTEQFLPIVPLEVEGNVSADYTFEPSKIEIIEQLIPKSLKTQLYKGIRDSFASEHGARMTAMHKATDNATEMRDQLKLTYNKARQASITNEILEIVGGAEALNN